MYPHGLRTSVATDNWQWFAAMLAIVAILIIGFVTDAPRVVFPQNTGADIPLGHMGRLHPAIRADW